MTTFGVEDVRAEGLGFGHSGVFGLRLEVEGLGFTAYGFGAQR